MNLRTQSLISSAALVILAACGGTAPASSAPASPSATAAPKPNSTSAAASPSVTTSQSAPTKPAASAAASASDSATAKSPIDHVVVIYLENRSFDHVYGLFPGAEGLAQVGAAATQVDKNGRPYDTLPEFAPKPADPNRPATRIPGGLPNKPFDMQPYVPIDAPMNLASGGDNQGTNSFYAEQAAIDGGKNDKFVAYGNTSNIGYYDGSNLPIWKYAQQFTLADHFFHAAFGGTGLNHFYLFCACTPTWPNAPTDIVAQVGTDGSLVKNGTVTPDGYLVNNLPTQQVGQIPQQTMPHIGDRLDEANVSWAWYTGGWNDRKFSANFAPFAVFPSTAVGTPGEAKHLKDEADFLTALKGSDLPSVAFVKPVGRLTEHPINSAGIVQGDQHAADLVKAVQDSPYWQSTAVIVTYDEGNGFWDHVAPPKVDRWGPGGRIPAIIISPYAKKGFVDKTVYDTTSILRFIESRWSLQPLTDRDAKANNLLNAFDFNQKM